MKKHVLFILLVVSSAAYININAGNYRPDGLMKKESKIKAASDVSASDPKIIGDWILYYIADDVNGNQQLDKAELSRAVQHWGRSIDERKSLLQLKGNGESFFSTVNIKTGATEQTEKGTWQLKDEGGSKILYQFSQHKHFEPGKAKLIKLDEQNLQWVYIEGLLPGLIYIYKRAGV